ncbi:MAG: VTC domain-containing protein [Myxococcales bacterium]|nr:VTC domain-containing protein [Myxococcales bacterium]
MLPWQSVAYFEATLSETQTWRDQDERRYELSRDVATRVLAKLGEHLPVMVYGDAPQTTLVATMYFDTPDRHYLERAGGSGGVSSVKVRAREYLPITNDQARDVLGHSEFCYLERKERHGTIRQKYRIKISKSELAPIVERILDLPCECEELRDEIREHDLHPVVVSMYERRVWGRSDDLRVTLDERIRYYRPEGRPYQSVSALTPSELGHPHALGPKRILEVKHAAKQALPGWLATLVEELPEATGFSKFLDGMAKLKRGQRRRSSLTQPVY